MTITQGPPTVWSTPTQFSQDLLAALNIPANDINVGYLNAWQGAEGQWGATGKYNATAQHNPLNTTLQSPGSTDLVQTQTPGVAVQSYSDPISGLDATARTLQAPRYKPILDILNAAGTTGNTDSPHSPGDFASAVGASGWGTNSANILAQWNKGDPGAVYSGGGILGTATLGALGSGATGPAPKCVWKVGPFCVLNTSSAGVLVMAGGGFVMLVGTIVLLFRFPGVRRTAEAIPVAGAAARVVSGRAPRARPRSSGSPERSEEQMAASRERRSRSGQQSAEEEAYRAGVQRGRASATAPPFPE